MTSVQAGDTALSAPDCTAPRRPFPLPHPEPSAAKVRRARDHLADALGQVAGLQDQLSVAPGTSPHRRPEWWLGRLQMLSSYLLLAMDEQDAARS